jgi:spore coat polysaccharide biosynthesis protein SpsF
MILGILQARVSSTRLPGKVLKPILGVPMLMRQMERIRRSSRMNMCIVATSLDERDEAIEQLCITNGITYFRGSLDNVLDRFYQAALEYVPKHIVRLTGDCPVIDPEIIDKTIDFHINGGFDYTSNALEPTFPDGMDVEVFTFISLEKAFNEASLPSHKEHVTPFIYEQSNRFKLGSYKNEKDLSGLRWTVDELDDFNLVEKIYEALYPQNPYFSLGDILELINNNPELKSINTHFMRNEGMLKSKQKDLKFSAIKR